MGRARYYKVYGSSAGSVTVEDSAGPYFENLQRTFPDIVSGAVRHAAFEMQKLLKKELRRGAPGGKALKPLSKVTNRKSLKGLRRRVDGRLNTTTLGTGSAGRKPYQRMVNAIGYEHNRRLNIARVGWLSRSASLYGQILQAGTQTRVTPTMRRYFAANRVILGRGTSVIDTPARPVFGPFYRAHKDEIPKLMIRRIRLKLDQAASKSASLAASSFFARRGLGSAA